MREYAVLDVETTGLRPSEGDRVIEVAVVRLDAELREVGRLDTLVAVPGSVGASDIHGIHPADLTGAPVFGEVAGAVGRLLAGATLVGHYPRFDLGFLDAELDRLGTGLPACRVIDTRDLCRAAGVRGGLRLVDCCTHFRVANERAHAAIADVLATAELLRRCVALGVDPTRHADQWPPRERVLGWPLGSLAEAGRPVALKQRAAAA